MPLWTQTGSPHPGYVAGRYYTIPGYVTNNVLALTENRLYFQPFYSPTPMAIDRFAFAITTGAGAAENEVRTGVYGTSSGRPGSRLIDNGRTVVGTGTGNITVTMSLTLPAGWSWLAIIANRAAGASATQPTLRAWANEIRAPHTFELYGASVPDATSVGPSIVSNAETVSDWTTYTLPATATSAVTEASVFPALWVRAA